MAAQAVESYEPVSYTHLFPGSLYRGAVAEIGKPAAKSHFTHLQAPFAQFTVFHDTPSFLIVAKFLPIDGRSISNMITILIIQSLSLIHI